MNCSNSSNVADNDDWAQKSEWIQSVPGVGKQTAAPLIADLPELGQLNRQEIAARVGVAPYCVIKRFSNRLEKRKRAMLRSNSPRNIPVQSASLTPAVLRVRTEGGPEFMERIGHALKTYLHPPPTPSSRVGIRRADTFHPNPNFHPDALEKEHSRWALG